MNRNQRFVYYGHLAIKGGCYIAHLMRQLTQRGWRLFWRWAAYGRKFWSSL